MKKIFTLIILTTFCVISAFAQDTLYVKPNTTSIAWSGRTNVYSNLQEAIDAANSGDEIWVAEGTYVPTSTIPNGNDVRCKSFILKAEVSLYGGFAGTETGIDERLTEEEDWEFTHATILSGDIANTPNDQTDNTYHVIYGVNASNMVIDGFVITGGYGNRLAYNNEQKGAGIFMGGSNESSHATNCIIRNCQLIQNTAQLNGGGAFLPYTCTMEHCLVADNSATAANSGGGGVFFDNCSYTSTVAEGCLFLRNTCSATSSLSNTSRYGGGAVSSGNNCMIENCTFELNNSTNAGGAVYCSNNNLFNYCFFFMNYSSNMGGAIYGHNSSGLLTSNCLFSNNAASTSGGCISISGTSCRSVNCTFVNHQANTYTVINGGSGFTVFNSILWNNGTDTDNLLPTSVNCMYTAADGILFQGTGNLNVNLNEIAFNDPCFIIGIPDNEDDYDLVKEAYYTLFGTSLCKDAGSTATINLSGYQFPDEDLNGEERINNNLIDLGCYEVQCTEDELTCSVTILDTVYSEELPGTGFVNIQFAIEDYDSDFTYNLSFDDEWTVLHEMIGGTYTYALPFPSTTTYHITRTEEETGCVVTISDEIDEYNDSIFPSGVADNKLATFTVHPNPATEFIDVQCPVISGQSVWELYDMSGRIVLSAPATSENTRIDISNYKSGSYILLLRNGKQIIGTTHVIKK